MGKREDRSVPSFGFDIRADDPPKFVQEFNRMSLDNHNLKKYIATLEEALRGLMNKGGPGYPFDKKANGEYLDALLEAERALGKGDDRG